MKQGLVVTMLSALGLLVGLTASPGEADAIIRQRSPWVIDGDGGGCEYNGGYIGCWWDGGGSSYCEVNGFIQGVTYNDGGGFHQDYAGCYTWDSAGNETFHANQLCDQRIDPQYCR